MSLIRQPIFLRTFLIAMLCSNFSLCLALTTTKPFTIMIDPAGDAKHTGRLIQDTLERGVSLQCAESLKAAIASALPNVRVILTRVPGETIQPLQNASFANRLDVDLYISLYFYQEPANQPAITVYYYLENSTDFWHKPIRPYFYSSNQAHLQNLEQTKKWGEIFLQIFQEKESAKIFIPQGLFGLPFKPLLGIKSSALAIEIGLKNKQDWQHSITPILQALKAIIA